MRYTDVLMKRFASELSGSHNKLIIRQKCEVIKVDLEEFPIQHYYISLSSAACMEIYCTVETEQAR